MVELDNPGGFSGSMVFKPKNKIMTLEPVGILYECGENDSFLKDINLCSHLDFINSDGTISY